MIWAKDGKLFFIKAIYKNHCVALPTEIFFKEVLVKKGKHIGLNYISIWYYKGVPFGPGFALQSFVRASQKDFLYNP